VQIHDEVFKKLQEKKAQQKCRHHEIIKSYKKLKRNIENIASPLQPTKRARRGDHTIISTVLS
jgi:predicted CopG family antitoxin